MSPIETEDRTDPRVRRTRQALRGALEALMAEKSFAAITVQDIAARAGVNRVTFYAHFRDKYDLLENSIRASFHERLRARLPQGVPFSPDNLALLIQIVCDFLAEMSGHCPPPHAQFEPLMEKQVKAELVKVLQAWLSERPTKAAPDLAAKVASWAIYGAAVQWSEQERPVPWRKFIQQVQPMILASLQVPRPSGA
jgi:AcrR family transcriptional regulator